MGEFIYPSCVVNLRLRFDETFRIADLPQPGPADGDPKTTLLPAQTAGRPTSPRATVGQAFRETGPGNYITGTRPLITQTGKNNLSFIADRVPKTCSVELPAYRQAGKFSLEIDWRELPIDPRLIRAAAVEIFIGTVSPDDFNTGMTGIDAVTGRRRSILRTTDNGRVRDDLMVMAGIADSWFSQQSGTSVVKFEGRDFRGVFLDTKLNPATLETVNLKQPIHKVVEDILKGHPASAYMTIIHNVDDWPDKQVPMVADSEGLTRVRRKADGDGASSGGDDKIKAWDLITKYCFLVGAVPYFRGNNLIIRPALSLFDQSKPRFNTAEKIFDPGTRYDDDGNPFTTRKMVFGRNIKDLSFERKLGGAAKVPVIEVVSFDTSSKERGLNKLLVEQWPPKDEKLARIGGVAPSGEVSQEDKQVIPVPGIRDRDKLLGIARSIWEEVGRGELGGACKTNQVASFKGDNDDPDLCRLRPGDMVEFLTDTRQVTAKAPGASSYIDDMRLSFDEAVAKVQEALASKGQRGDENLARVIVASARSAVVDLMREFRVANVVFQWSNDSLQTAFDFQNYFVVRYGINDQLGANVAPVTKTVINPSTARRQKERIVPRPQVSAPRPPKPVVTIGRARREE